jgi:hypothetical protein
LRQLGRDASVRSHVAHHLDRSRAAMDVWVKNWARSHRAARR